MFLFFFRIRTKKIFSDNIQKISKSDPVSMTREQSKMHSDGLPQDTKYITSN